MWVEIYNVNLSGSEATLLIENVLVEISYVIECIVLFIIDFPGSMMISWILDDIILNTCKESLFSLLVILVLSDNYLF